MPNWCYYEMKVVGDRDAINELVSVLTNHHPKYQFYRVPDADVYVDEENHACICGNAAWSVRSAMMDYCGKCNGSEKEFITISKLSERLQLEIEIFSDEPGICFQEHFLIRNGEIIINDCIDCVSFYFDGSDYEGATKEEKFTNCLKNNGIGWNITLDDLDEDGWYRIGGIENWGEWNI